MTAPSKEQTEAETVGTVFREILGTKGGGDHVGMLPLKDERFDIQRSKPIAHC